MFFLEAALKGVFFFALAKWFESAENVSTEIQNKGVLSTTLIPQEQFCHILGITQYFNHVMGHQVEGLQRFPCVFGSECSLS